MSVECKQRESDWLTEQTHDVPPTHPLAKPPTVHNMADKQVLTNQNYLSLTTIDYVRIKQKPTIDLALIW